MHGGRSPRGRSITTRLDHKSAYDLRNLPVSVMPERISNVKVCFTTGQRKWLGTSIASVCVALGTSLIVRPSFMLTAVGDSVQTLLLVSLFVAVARNTIATV